MNRNMSRLSILLLVLVLTLASLSHAQPYRSHGTRDHRAVELNSVKDLIFKKGEMTTGRRTSPVAQLKCVGGGACGTRFEPEVVRCTNIGVDYATGDPQWKCTAELASGLRLGTTDVICEGFDDRDDPFVLRGSCGLEYTLQGTPREQQQQQQDGDYAYRSNSQSYRDGYYTKSSYKQSSSSSGSSWLNWIAFLLCVYILGRYMFGSGDSSAGARQANAGAAPPGGGGGGGQGFFGGGGGGFPGFGGGFPGFGGGGYRANDCAPGYGAGLGGGGNFWQGMGLGGGLGYLFGRNNNWGGYNRGYGGYNGGYQQGYHRQAQRPAYEPRRAPPPPPSGPATETSTGYGTTRRRG